MTTSFDGIHRDEYPGASTSVYLDNAAVGLISERVKMAAATAAADHSLFGIGAAPQRNALIAKARETSARLIAGRPDRVAFTQNTSTGIALVTNGISWRDGDNVVVPSGEFPSNFYPWTQLRRLGVEIREAPMRDGFAHLDDIRNAIDSRTKVVAISAVQYSSGHRNDVAAIAEAITDTSALLVVDATQALGALQIDVASSGIDVLAVSAHKWMLAPLGIGFVHLSDRAMNTLHPSTVGWMSVERPFDFDHEPSLASDARRFESGTENTFGIAGLDAAMSLVLEAGIDTVERRVLDTTEILAEQLSRLGWHIQRPESRRDWSGILIASAGNDDQSMFDRLQTAGVRCSLRGSGIRFSPHYFTDSSDLDALTEVISA